jgi:gliding motility-associated-like protein
MKQIYTFIILIILPFFVKSQLIVTNNETPIDLVQNYLVGSGVTVSNITFNGMPGNTIDNQIGFFNGVNTNLGIDSGIVMSTGLVLDIAQPEAAFASTSFFTQSFDPDLNAISAVNVNDPAILEFDIVPTGDTLEFRYSFASEEYPSFSAPGSSFIDAFGLFLSGPGIAGPFSNGAVNIALVPGTTTPVSIVNISQFVNTNYYINNTGNPHIVFGGRTVTLTAKYPVQCGQTYHLKFAIGDGGDNSYDSGVFIEAGSLSSTGVQVSMETPVGFFSNAPGVVYEGCLLGSDVDFIFVRPDASAGDTVFFDLGGTATNGVDYSLIPNNYVVFNNSDTAILTISVFDDGIPEGDETVWIAIPLANSGPCSNVYDTTFLIISDPYTVVPYAGPDSIYYCPGQILDYVGNVNIGVPPYNYTWSNGTNNPNVSYTITQLGNDTLILDVVDGCGFIGSDTVYFLQQAPPPIFVDAGPDVIFTCAGQTTLLGGNASGGVPPLSLSWNSPTTTVQPLVDTDYILTVTDDCLNQNSDTLTVFVPPFIPLSIVQSNSMNSINCIGDATTLYGYATGGGTPPYDYQWSTGSTDSLINVTVISPNANYVLTISDACGLDTTINFQFNIDQTPLNINFSSIRQCRNADSTASIEYNVIGGIPPYSIQELSFPFGVSNFVIDSVSKTVLIYSAQEGIYSFSVTDLCGNYDADSTELSLMNCEITTPNVITPNGDGINDELVFGGLGNHPNSELYIYNRWGNLVYSSTDYQNDWDGGGLSPGVYYYVLVLTDGTTPSTFNGHVNIFY